MLSNSERKSEAGAGRAAAVVAAVAVVLLLLLPSVPSLLLVPLLVLVLLVLLLLCYCCCCSCCRAVLRPARRARGTLASRERACVSAPHLPTAAVPPWAAGGWLSVRCCQLHRAGIRACTARAAPHGRAGERAAGGAASRVHGTRAERAEQARVALCAACQQRGGNDEKRT